MTTSINKNSNVEKQYRGSNNLEVRINLHNKYSTNDIDFISFLFDNYKFYEEQRILELGAGTGMQWINRVKCISNSSELILSDNSDEMVNILHEKFLANENISAMKIDIENIPFPDDSFDVVIANHMLYHVDDLTKSIQEVHRVLKRGGLFYSTTNSNFGIRLFVHKLLEEINNNTNSIYENYSFSLENGESILKKHFVNVKTIVHFDSLEITDTNDLIEWIKSVSSISNFEINDFSNLREYLEEMKGSNGFIKIEKNGCLFIVEKL